MPNEIVRAGVRGELELVVADGDCTRRGSYQIFSTPSMVMFLEKAAIEALKPYLSDEQISVGTRVDVQHLAPTLKGMRVTAVATVRDVDGSRVTFDVELRDDVEKVGQATHDRFVLDLDRYVRRLERKASQVASERADPS
jgi:fluoroacetyl-CoA thioesterase